MKIFAFRALSRVLFSVTGLLALVQLQQCTSKLVTFSNIRPRHDSTGAIINAHDGTTQRFPSKGKGFRDATNSSSDDRLFYYHAMGYPDCPEPGTIQGCTHECVYNRTNSIAVWTSPDLSDGSWELQQLVYPSPNNESKFPTCTYFRSQAVYNPNTGLYVMWANTAGCDHSTCPNGTCLSYVMATSEHPGGPFTFAATAQPSAASLGPHSGFIGDYALFVDSDGKGYCLLTHGIAGAGHRDMYIFRLTDDFLSFDSNTSVGPLPGPHLVEAPAMFRRGSTYYALLGGCTCMGLYGSGVAVLQAPHPLGPWTNMTSTLDPGCPMEQQSTCFEMGPGEVCNPVTQAQQNFVVEVPLANGSSTLVWTGDKWQQSPDKAFDKQPQTWLPLYFAGDTLLPLRYVDNFTLDVAL